MTKKHFIIIAKAIKNNSIYSNNSTRRIIKKDALINDLCNEFISLNPLFDWDKFKDACSK